ncbi:unnamed protein product [Pleuronectes platessa]|uniref:Uncharacterized protein n=1 Tax=Pleuronectes platessa TaxID=8262 RepID=A0A9N7Y4H7_PLEPL|nr:unnamed protein product [Pleuronectes platessa]
MELGCSREEATWFVAAAGESSTFREEPLSAPSLHLGFKRSQSVSEGQGMHSRRGRELQISPGYHVFRRDQIGASTETELRTNAAPVKAGHNGGDHSSEAVESLKGHDNSHVGQTGNFVDADDDDDDDDDNDGDGIGDRPTGGLEGRQLDLGRIQALSGCHYLSVSVSPSTGLAYRQSHWHVIVWKGRQGQSESRGLCERTSLEETTPKLLRPFKGDVEPSGEDYKDNKMEGRNIKLGREMVQGVVRSW